MHPLSRFPGPRLWGATRMAYSWELINGRGHKAILDLHKRYGDIVRIAPEELSVCSPEMWREVWGRRKTELGEIPKDDVHYSEALPSILGCPKPQHTRFRRILAPSFTGTAVVEQSPYIKTHVDNLFRKLHSHVNVEGTESPIDMAEWFDFTTADISSDLSFGDSFNCLNTGKYHPWAQIFNEAHIGHAFAKATQRFAVIYPILKFLGSNSPLQKRWDENVAETKRLVDRRLLEADRPDFIRSLASHGDSEKEPLNREEIQWNAQILMSAGYDTTAVALGVAAFLLATNREWAKTVLEEIEAAYTSKEDITGLTTLELPRLNATLDEALRLLPPAGSAMPRIVPAPGEQVFGEFMPGGTILTMWMWSTYRNPANFKNPDDFCPERWLGDPEYDSDRKDVFMPFSFGMRACIGRQ